MGYEIALAGAPRGERGHVMTLTGVGYEVEGLASLRAVSGLEIVGSVTERDERGVARVIVTTATARTTAGGRFTLRVDLPDRPLRSPQLELDLHRLRQPGRRFVYGLSTYGDVALDLLTDRNRYQPGELVRAWLRVRGIRAEAPIAGQRVKITLYDQSGQPLGDHEATTTASGAVTAELELPDTAEAGQYRVRAEVLGAEGGPEVSRTIQVWRRTVERLMAEVELDRADEDGVALVRPGGPLAGRVIVTTPSGTPVRGATVELRARQGAAVTTLTTNGEGVAAFDLHAPSFLAGDVGSETVSARVVHTAYGTITASAGYLMARVPAVVSATARGGALIPEVDSTVYVSVSDPRGRPLVRGTEVVVRGAGLPADGRVATLDEKGFAEVVVQLPRGAASTMRGGDCAGRVAATFEIEVRTDPPRFSRSCVSVSGDAELGVEVTSAPLAAPGSTVDVRVRRRPAARGRAVLVEALFGGRAVAFTWIDGRADTGDLTIPDDLLGIIQIRARALRDANDREDADEPGATAFGIGAFDAVLVRPADAFSLSVSPERPRYLVREPATVSMVASQATANGWAALLVRDESAHGGEGPWDLYWMRGALHEAAQQPANETNARFLRASLSGSLGVDPEPPRPPELEPPYWRNSRHQRPYTEGLQAGRGVLRDPTALREEMLRRGLGSFEMLLEQTVAQLGPTAADRAPVVQGRGFHPGVIAHLVAQHRITSRGARTLGGEPLTVGMIEAADPGFSFDIVGRRVARQRLSKLLLALLNLTDPDNQNAQRASANLPPERWLGTLVQLNMVQASDLTDPWGHPYVLRRVTGRRPRVAVSERALDWELASPGPDGRLNTADDVNDPFARAVPAGTPYAVTSGEETLMRQLSALAPASIVLTRMSQAYQRLSLAAQEEQVSGPVGASGSEIADEDMAFAETESTGRGRRSGGGGGEAASDSPLAGLDGLDDEGGNGYAARARPTQAMAPPPPPGAPSPEPVVAAEMQQRLEEHRAEALGTLIREDFPATLFFVGEVPLTNGRAQVEVPLADALTTYRLEAIAWTPSGWTTSGESRVRVDQRALVDAPVPEFATVGDSVRLPVRVENRTDAELPLRIVVQAEGELSIAPVAPIDVTLPARGARESVVEIALREPGEGSLVVSIESGGEGIDAVRRPLHVQADARTARDRRVALVDGATDLGIDVPAEASERGPGQLRLSVGARLFGDVDGADGSLWAAWTLAMAGEPLPEALQERAHGFVSYEDYGQDALRDPMQSALALGATWRDDRLSDADAARALRSIGQNLPARELLRQIDASNFGPQPAWLLLAMAPMARDLDRRPALREDAATLLQRLREITAIHATAMSDAPNDWSRAAAALALAGGMDARAEELVRRTARHLVRVDGTAWVEPEQPQGREPRAQPTALMALAQIALGRRTHAVSLVRALVDMHLDGSTPPPPWIIEGDIVPRPYFDGTDRYLAAAAAARLTTGTAGPARVLLDGAPIETTEEGGVIIARLPHVGAPGAHQVRVELPEGTVALAHFAVAYLLPWDLAPRRDALIEVTLDGERGARDTRAGLRLRVQNRGGRILTRPVVEVELPAGSELDEPTRERLASLLRGDAHMEGRTLILPLRPLAPAGWVVLPLPVRWALSGTLRGLGTVAYDELGPDRAEALPVSVLPSQGVELPDEGPEPQPPDPEASDPERPIRPPLPIVERLAPGGA
ncbi:MAG: hypothetical protein H6719_23630 [Sandaracinaceae bacterium]|nr:hypothetical protein [Sandaracinaceae bacterium]